MNQYKIFETTKKINEIPLKYTQSVVEKSKKLRCPSPRAAKIGSIAGTVIGTFLLLIGTIWFNYGKVLFGAGAVLTGLMTIISNFISYKTNKKKYCSYHSRTNH